MPVSSHPNAEVALYTGALSFIILYVVGLFGLAEPPAEIGSALATVLTGVALLLGKRRKE